MKRALLLLLTSCATLNTDAMSEGCRAVYNRCLNQCPSAQSSTRRPAENPNGPQARFDSQQSLMVDVAACTQTCNDDAKLCH